MSFSLTRLLREMRERGLENTFQRFYSNYQAKVVDVADEKAMGRVKIRLESLGYPDDHNDFIEYLSPYAGDDFGFYFPPYMDDEVYVTFDHGDVSSPMYAGGYWATADEKKVTDSELPAEFINTKTGDNNEKIGDKPTIRGLKVRRGSALVFDETEDLEHVELWAGESQGKGKRAIKRHRLRLDDKKDNGQVVLATYGIESPEAEEANEDDAPDVRDKKELEGRFRHQILMRDTDDDRFVEWRTPGDKDKKDLYHRVLMSDTEELVRVKTNQNHFWEVNDKDKRMFWEMLESADDGATFVVRGEANMKDEFIVWETTEEYRLRIDQKNKSNTLETPNKQQIIQDDTNTLVNDDDHDINVKTGKNFGVKTGKNFGVEVTEDTNFTIMGNFNIDVTKDWMSRISGALSLLVAGEVTIQGSTISVTSAQIEIGQGGFQALLNEVAMLTFNTHTHNYLLPVHPVSSTPTAPPNKPMVKGADTTVNTTAS